MHEVGKQLGWGPEETERQLGIGRYAKHAAHWAGYVHAAHHESSDCPELALNPYRL